jgi:hypothetical protein
MSLLDQLAERRDDASARDLVVEAFRRGIMGARMAKDSRFLLLEACRALFEAITMNLYGSKGCGRRKDRLLVVVAKLGEECGRGKTTRKFIVDEKKGVSSDFPKHDAFMDWDFPEYHKAVTSSASSASAARAEDVALYEAIRKNLYSGKGCGKKKKNLLVVVAKLEEDSGRETTKRKLG